MYRIVNTYSVGNVIVVKGNNKYEMYNGANLNSFCGTIPTSELADIDKPTDNELVKIVERHLVA